MCTWGAQAQSAYVAPKRLITLSITEASPAMQPPCDDWDFYIKSKVGGVQMPDLEVPFSFEGTHCGAFAYSAELFDNLFVTSSNMLACDESPVEIDIQLFERDGLFDPDDPEAHIIFSIDPLDDDPASLSGCHDEGDNGGFCWEIQIQDPTRADQDGDGLPDEWEVNGFDANCDGQIVNGEDVLLPQMGANPNHKDIFIEVNWYEGYEPPAEIMQEVKNAFADAPVDAGGTANPDGANGITLHFDAGSVLNDLGLYGIGGRLLGPPANAPDSADELKALMDAMEDVKRRGIFRQIVYGPLLENAVPAPAFGRFVGNDRIQIEARTSATLMHELGHALGLLHGGEIVSPDPNRPFGRNCKPNHISIMNRLYRGLPFETGGGTVGVFVDFAPSKIPDSMIVVSPSAQANCPAGSFGCNRRLPLIGLPASSGVGTTADLVEWDLDETTPILVDDFASGLISRHILRFYNANGDTRTSALVDPVDWDDDGTLLPSVAATIDTNPDDTNSQGCGPALNSNLEILDNIDEWSQVQIPPGRGALGLLADPDAFFEDDLPATTQEMIDDMLRQVQETDLAVAASIDPSPVYVGSQAALVVEVTNNGRNPGFGGNVEVTLPAGVTAAQVPAACELTFPSVYRCTTMVNDRALRPAATVTFSFTVGVEANTTGRVRTVLVRVEHDGEDPVPANDSVAVPIYVLPEFMGFDDSDRPWVVSWSGGTPISTTPTNSTSGSMSGSLDCGFRQFESPTFDTTEVEVLGNSLVVDVWIPQQQDLNWPGTLALYIDIPSANVWQLGVGLVELVNLARDTWVPVEFSIPEVAKEALVESHPDARFRFESNVATCGFPLLLDSIRFDDDPVARTIFDHGDTSASVTSSSVLTFEVTADWSSDEVTVAANETQVTQGQRALSIPPAAWARVSSRPFDTADLVGVTSRLSFDVHIPDLPADYYYYGTMGVFLECPSAEVWSAYIGHQSLHILFDDEYNRVEFEVPPHALAALQGSYNDCRFFFDFERNENFGPVILDRGGFVQ